MARIAPSVLNADFSKMDNWLLEFEKASADAIHWDLIDNRFVPNSGVELKWIPSVRKKTGLLFDCHLMVEKPEAYFEKLAEFGADSVTFHVETMQNPAQTIQTIRKIRDFGLNVGIAINAQTPPEKVLPFLDKVDTALVMSVQAGFGGQGFLAESLEKTKKLSAWIEKEKAGCQIQVDGGVNLETGKQAVAAGANILVAGSFVFKQKSVSQAILDLKSLQKGPQLV